MQRSKLKVGEQYAHGHSRYASRQCVTVTDVGPFWRKSYNSPYVKVTKENPAPKHAELRVEVEVSPDSETRGWALGRGTRYVRPLHLRHTWADELELRRIDQERDDRETKVRETHDAELRELLEPYGVSYSANRFIGPSPDITSDSWNPLVRPTPDRYTITRAALLKLLGAGS